jgi:chromate transporter
MPGGGSSGPSQPSTPGYSLVQLLRYFLYLGSAGFGGPVAPVEYMHRDLVERRHWISDDEYRERLALANLSPGLSLLLHRVA